MKDSTRVLVTGGAGFIGSHLSRALLERGYDVRILDDLSTGSLENLSDIESSIDFLRGDVRDPVTLRDATGGVRAVFHLAALASVARSMEEPEETHAVNVTGTLQLLQACHANGVARVVFSSSSSVYGDAPALPKRENLELEPRSPYAVSKLAAEQYVLAYARAGLVEGVALRYFNIFGPRQDPLGPYAAVIPLLMRAAMLGSTFTIFGDGRQTRDFTYVDNAVQANILGMTTPAPQASGQVVNVGAGVRTSLLQLVQSVEKLAGMRIGIDHRPPRAGDVRDSLADVERARRALGYLPLVGLDEGLRRTWTWYQGAFATTADAL
jgi:UDP-glucose 4-epimerase